MAQDQDSKGCRLTVILKSPRREPSSEAQTRAKVLPQGNVETTNLTNLNDLPKAPSVLPTSGDERDRAYRQGNWTPSNIITLLEAKRKEVEMSLGSGRFSMSADEKWKFVEDYCRNRGVDRTKEQCKIKWDNLQPEYRKIKEYEQHRDAFAPSYFHMEAWERRSKLLPSNIDAEVYSRILDIHALKQKGGRVRSATKVAREKKSQETIVRAPINGDFEGSDDDEQKDADACLPFSAFVGKHMIRMPRKSKKKRVVEGGRIHECESVDDSSTEEEDSFVIASRCQPAAAQQPDERAMASSHKTTFNGKDAASLSNKDTPNDAERSNGHGTHEDRQVSSADTLEQTSSKKEHKQQHHIQDQKDARHKELVELEREKLAVFREACLAIANAMNGAVAAFSKLAEELLFSRRP